MVRYQVVSTPQAETEVLRVTDAAPQAFLLPGASGGIRAYESLCERLTTAGLVTAGLNPRGCGASTGDLEDLTLDALAEDVVAVIQAIGAPPVLVIGHAGGNRVARMVATSHPDAVRGVVLLAAGGKVPASREGN